MTLGCLFSIEKYDGLSKSVGFAEELRHFTDQNDKVNEENGAICLVSMFLFRVMVLKLSKKDIFCDFVVTSVRNLSLLKQFTYMHPKGPVMHFHKVALFIMS